ncbi:MAG: hypothetical protein QG657_5033, partial [Acidobacteriota bacterium]|nr:hypothetical protein [Acidobacteriota bacterium]
MSNPNKPIAEFYVVGGTLRADAPSYIERAADRELYEHTLAGDFCYVLTPRQMGKSSLMARTAGRLKKEGVRTAILDLTQIGTEQEKQSAGQWYYGIAYRIVKELGIAVNLSDWWGERGKLPALQRLTEFFGDVVLAGTKEPVVIFVDEIDTTIGLRFSDDFFAAVRACYNARATQPEYRRLSFVLLGVATPSQLIKDARRTPFNIGHPIELTDFTYEEALPLAQCLAADRGQGEEALKRILYWSGGHPYLTQRLCQLAAGEKATVSGSAAIDGLVQKHFLALEAQRSDSNINFVRDRLVQKKKYSRNLLTIYRRILKGHFIADEPLSITHALLKLSGLVVPAEKRGLRVRNRIYQGIFTRDWVKEVMPVNWTRDIAAASIAVLFIGLAIWYTQFLPKQYIERLRTAKDDVPLVEYNKLKSFPGFAGRADELFAAYWDRRALRAESQEERDDGLLYRLKALTVKDTATRRQEPARLLAGDYTNLLVTVRHNRAVTAVAFSPDGKTLLTGSDDGTARLWRTDNGQPMAVPINVGSIVNAVAFSPDGKTLLTGSLDCTARLWCTDNGEPVGKPIMHGKAVNAVTFSPDGITILTGSDDGIARLWRINNGRQGAKLIKQSDAISAVAFSPNGKIVLTGSKDGTVQLWSADNGKSLPQPIRHRDWIRSVAFSPDGKTILTGSDDGTARLWRAANGQPLTEPIKHGRAVNAVAFSPDGKTILTGSDDGTARLWRADNGHPLAEPINVGSPVNAVAFSPDGITILTGSEDGTARLWSIDFKNKVPEAMQPHCGSHVETHSSNGKTELAEKCNDTVQVYHVEKGSPMKLPRNNRVDSQKVIYSPDGKTEITVDSNGKLQLRDAKNGKRLAESIINIKYGNLINMSNLSPDGKTIVIGSEW